MNITTVAIIFAVLGFIIGGVYFIYKSARKFNLTEEQKQRIAQRNKALDKQEQAERDNE
ncbi:DUF2897 family protein [Thalassotalea litorea]|uniref:DUF2897 family protein n=1 Tax=Thalassotalea litorea TaxID=2020715 RepID=UPI003734C3F6